MVDQSKVHIYSGLNLNIQIGWIKLKYTNILDEKIIV